MLRKFAPVDVPRRLLMGSGPSNAEPRVLQAMAAAALPGDDPEYPMLLADIDSLGQHVFQARAGRSLGVPGASRSGLEAVLASLVEPGQRVVVGVYGHFGELLCTLAARHGATVERIDAEWGRPVDADEFAARVRANPPRLAAIVHADTSTGILQPLEPIAAACRETGTLLLVDAVLSIGGCEVDAAGWGIDAVVGGLQKCLGGPPGLALLALSPRAQTALRQAREAPRQTAYLDLSRIPESHETSTPMLMAAREALRMVCDEGLAERWRRHARASRALRAGIDAMQLRRFGDRQHQVPMITLVSVPDGVDEAGVRQQLLAEHGVEIMAAFGPLRGRVWRIGTMGTNACLPSVLTALSALEAVLASRHYKLPRGAAVHAARHAWTA